MARRLLAAAGVCLALVFGAPHAGAGVVPLLPKDVLCGDVTCGTLEVSKYAPSAGNATAPVDGYLGIDIEGLFKPSTKNTFHFIQGITGYNATDRRWINDTSVPIGVPFVDTPPGGYYVKSPWNAADWTAAQPFDTKPYYDEAGDNPPFPAFYDTPGMWMQPAKAGLLSWSFETWLVCVISELAGPDATTAREDMYTLAPLLGFQWGFDISYKDVGVIGTDELADFTVALKDLDWVTTPTAAWKSALNTKYGTGENQDYFNITLDTCDKCTVAEPGSLTLALAALSVLWLSLGSGAAIRLRPATQSLAGQRLPAPGNAS